MELTTTEKLRLNADLDGDLLPISNMLKPMKAPNKVVAHDHKSIPYDRGLVDSPKLDGNRGRIINGDLFTSTTKHPRNRRVYEFMVPLLEVAKRKSLFFDFEIYDPAASHHAALSGIINSYAMPLPETTVCAVFDCAPMRDFQDNCLHLPFSERLHMYNAELGQLSIPEFIAIPQVPVADAAEAKALYEKHREQGLEGSMLRALHIHEDKNGKPLGGWYKFGRATPAQGMIFKFKEFVPVDGIIVGVIQMRKLKDGLERQYAADGSLARPQTHESFTVTDAVGALTFKWIDEDGNEWCTDIGFGKGFSIKDRQKMWHDYQLDPATLIGKWGEVLHMPHGGKIGGGMRHGRLKRFRPDKD